MGKEILHQGEAFMLVGTDASCPWEGMEDVHALAVSMVLLTSVGWVLLSLLS